MLLIRGRALAGFLFVFLCSMTCSVLTVTAYHAFFAQKTVVMDIAGFIASQKEGYVTGKISAGELVENIDSLVSRMHALQKRRIMVIDRAAARSVKEGPAAMVPDPPGDDDDDREGWPP